MSTPERYAFGDFILERSQQRVRSHDGTQLNLTPRLFGALLLFVERPGQLLDKDSLILALWPDLVVEENNLSQVIAGLRRALGDDAQGSRYIQTVPRRGFRFVAKVTTLPDDDDAAAAAEQRAASRLDPSPSSSPSPPSPTAAAAQAANFESSGAGIDAPIDRTLAKRHWLRLAFAGAAIAGVGGAAWWSGRRPREALPSNRATLAVLPFKPLVIDGRDELLEIGMADSLIARLSTVPGLVVRSVGSVRRYAGSDQDPLHAARELDVAWIVDGSLQRRGDRLRVTARLLSAEDGVAAWSGSFDEKFTDFFDMQDAISERVAGVLTPRLDATARGQHAPLPAAAGSRDPDAYQLYLAARQHAQGIREAGLRKSVELYNKALAIDPSFARAYAGLVESYRRMVFGADVAPIEAFEPAKIAAQRALSLAPNLAEAHAGLGWIRYWFDFDWPGAERVFRQALALNPNTVEAHFGLGLLLSSLDRAAEGLAHLRAARELDPMSLIVNTIEAGYLIGAGRRDEGAARLNRVFEIDPNFWVAQLTLGILHLVDRDPDKALIAFRRADALADGSSQAAAILGRHLARFGRSDEARDVLRRLTDLEKKRYVPPTSVAAILAALGEITPALDALDRAFVVRDTRLVYMKDDGRWSNLRNEPRFIALLRRMGLDQVGAGNPTLGDAD